MTLLLHVAKEGRRPTFITSRSNSRSSLGLCLVEEFNRMCLVLQFYCENIRNDNLLFEEITRFGWGLYLGNRARQVQRTKQCV